MQKIIEADASELVAELTTPAPSEAFSLFRIQPDGSKKEFKLRVRLLREQEHIACMREAQAYAKENGELSTEYRDIYKEATACALVSRALLRPKLEKMPSGAEYYPQLFTSTEQLRRSFTENETAVCLNAYEVVKAKYRCFDDWKPEELDKWAGKLSDTFLGPLVLSRLDSAHWPDLIYGLARRVLELTELAGLPPLTSDDSSESSQENSGDGTGGSTPSPSVASSDGQELPTDHLMTRAEADAVARKMREPK